MAYITGNPHFEVLHRFAFNIWSLIRLEWMVAVIMVELALLLHKDVTSINLMLVLALGIGYGFAYAINNYFDQDVDSIDPEKAGNNFFLKYQLSKSRVLTLFLVTVSVLLVIASQFGYMGYIALLCSVFISWSYSSKPFKFKTKPGLDLLIHGIFVLTYPYFITIVLIVSQFSIFDILLMASCLLISMTVQLEQQIRDYDVDRRVITNFTVKFGPRVSTFVIKLCTIVVLAMVILSLFLAELSPIIYTLALFCSPVILNKLNPSKSTIRSEKLIVIMLILSFIYINAVFLLRLLLS